jgi:TRAP-type C4-dicarboxylate transport system substrate-binding protein
MNRVNERGKGILQIDYLGGPEVIKALDQPEAVKSGVVDICVVPISYYKAVVPEGGAVPLSPYTFHEEREVGIYDFLHDIHAERLNAYLLGGTNKGAQFALFTNVKVDSPSDFAGQKFRTLSLYDPLFKALGIVGVSMPAEDIYTAMDRGTVDGYAYKPPMAVTLGIHEVTNYWIEPFIWGGGSVQIMINMDKWNALSQEAKDLLNDTQFELEPEVEAYLAGDDDTSKDNMRAAGMEPIIWTGADAQLFIETANNSLWDELKQKLSAEQFEKIKKLYTK